MITRATLSTIEQGLPKYRSMLAGNTAFSPTSFESIATVTVGSGGSSSATFSNIPNTYSHLQLRIIGLLTTNIDYSGWIRVGNGSIDSGNNYSWHYLRGNGSLVEAGAGSTTNLAFMWSSATQTSNTPSTVIIDILDYANTNKYKTIRGLGGADRNGSGWAGLFSGSWQSTSAITNIEIDSNASTSDWGQYSSFALYGIKSA